MRIVPIMVVLVLGLCVSCRQRREDNSRMMAEQLYGKTVNLIKLYQDSVRNAKDSVSVLRMTEDINDKLSKVNFQFPPETDYAMTEEENDSIMHMMERFENLSQTRLEQLAPKVAELSDSVKSES